MKVLEINDNWFGVIYKEDKPAVVDKSRTMTVPACQGAAITSEERLWSGSHGVGAGRYGGGDLQGKGRD